ncbi:Ent-kaurene oxidase, partial [Leucoagaricus sp. SymC.cos]
LILMFTAGQPDLRHIPTTGFSSPILSYIDVVRYHWDARAYVQRGYDKYKNQAFKVPNIRSWYVVLNGNRYLEELQRASEDALSSRALVNEATSVILGPDFANNHYHISVIRNQMTRNIPEFFGEMYDEVKIAFARYLPVSDDWAFYNPNRFILQIVCQAVNRICVGAPYCRDDALITSSLGLAPTLHLSGRIVGGFPKSLRPYVAYFLPGVLTSKQNWIKILTPIIDERRTPREKNTGRPADVLTWLMDEARGDEQSNENLATRILMINNGALSTTTFMSTHVLYHLASEPRYIKLLRGDIETVIATDGWTKSGVDKMHKLDSFIKETMRVHPISIGLVGHIALKDYTFSDGTLIPKGTTVVAPADAVHHDDTYPNAREFQGFRFVESSRNKSDRGGGEESLVNLTPNFLPFGHGNHACPGRFFAASSMKLVLAYMLLHYDFILEGGSEEGAKRPKDLFFGGLRLPNQKARLLVRKRRT